MNRNTFHAGVAALGFDSSRPFPTRRYQLLGLVLVCLALLVVSTVLLIGGGDVSRAPIPAPTANMAAPSSAAPSDGRNGTPFALAAGRPLFPLTPGALGDSLIDAPVEMQDVPIAQSINDAHFWVGVDSDQRVLAVLEPDAGPAPGVLPSPLSHGTLVNLSGHMRKVPDDITTLHVNPDAGLDQLEMQGQYLSVDSLRKAG